MAEQGKKTNAARRLHQVLSQVVSEGHAHRQETAWDVWKSVCDVSDDETLLRRLGQVIELIHEVEHRLKDVITEPEKQRFKVRHFSQIKKAVSFRSFRGAWSDMERYLDDKVLESLQDCAFELDVVGEVELEKEFLEGLYKDVNALIEETLAADIKPELKEFLIEGFRTISDAILDYRLRGSAPLKQAFELAVGRWKLKEEMLRKHEQTSHLNRFLSILYRVFQAVSMADRAYGLTTKIPAALEEAKGLAENVS